MSTQLRLVVAALMRDAPLRSGLGVAAVALLGGGLTLNHNLVGVFYDDGLYAGLGWALGHGLGYIHPNLPGAPVGVHFPPLYPLLLAPLFASLPPAAAGFAGKLLNVGLAGVGAGLIAWHATRRGLLGAAAPWWLAAAVVGAASLAVPMLTVLTSLLSEPLFGALLAAAVILADEAPPTSGGFAWQASLAGLAAALALLTRSIGVAAGAGIVLFLLGVRRAHRDAVLIAALPVAGAALVWGIWVLRFRNGIDPALAADYGTYGDVLHQAGLSTLATRPLDLPRPLAVLTLGWVPSFAAYYLLGVPALAVGVYGLWLLVGRSSVGLTLACYLAILAVWPVPPDRFLWAVLRGFAGRWWAAAPQRISANLTELVPWVGSLPRRAVVATDAEPLFWLYTGRRAVPSYLFTYEGGAEVRASPAEQLAFFERAGVTHVLLTGPGPATAQLAALVATAPGRLKPVHRWSGGRVAFEVAREP